MNHFLDFLKDIYPSKTLPEINRILEKEHIGIEQIIDQQLFLELYKTSSIKATQIMTYEKLQKLVQFITVEGPPHQTNRSYKYPMIACQLLSSPNKSTIDYFFTNGSVVVEESVFRKTSFAKEKQEQNSQSQQSNSDRQSSSKSQESDSSQRQSESQSERSSLSSDQQSLKTHNKKQKYRFISPLIDSLFKPFQNQLNYTLAGYTCRVLNNFLQQKPYFVIEYVLEDENMQLIFRNIQCRSMGDFLANILVSDIEELITERKLCFNRLIEKFIDPQSSAEIISSFSLVIREVIQKLSTGLDSADNYKQLIQVYFNCDNFQKLMKSAVSDNDITNYYAPGVFYQYVCQILVKREPNSEIADYLKGYWQKFVQKTLCILDRIHQQKQVLGIGRVRLIQTILVILQKIVYCRQITSQNSDLFPSLCALFTRHPLNNILHNHLVKIFKLVICLPIDCPLRIQLLKGGQFLNFVDKSLSQVQNRSATYRIHLLEIKQTIQNQQTQLPGVLKDPVSSKSTRSISSSSLGGYTKEQYTDNIEFSKDAILEKYRQFLANGPPPIFQLKQCSLNNIRCKPKNQMKEGSSQTFQSHQQEQDQVFWSEHPSSNTSELIDDL